MAKPEADVCDVLRCAAMRIEIRRKEDYSHIFGRRGSGEFGDDASV
jgi:hypothetical protein